MIWVWILLQQAPTEPGDMAVHVREAALKERPSFAARTVGRLSEGDVVSVAEIQGNWGRIERDAGPAWIHLSAVIQRERYQPLAGTDAAARTSDTFIATKGFNPEVEAARRQDANLDAAYRVVDRIERTPAWTSSLDRAAQTVDEFRRRRGLGQ